MVLRLNMDLICINKVTVTVSQCSSHMFVIHVRHTGLSHMFVTHVRHICSSHMFVTYVRHICSSHVIISDFILTTKTESFQKL